MLLRFGVENYLSFRDYTELSFVSTAYKDEPSYRIPLEKVSDVKHGVLPVIALFGANASGKSNLLTALKQFQDDIILSAGRPPSQKIEVSPFLLNNTSRKLPSRFDCDFILDGVRYHYGFAVSQCQYEEEWLYAWPRGSKQIWFHRSIHEKEAWYFGSKFKGPKKQVADRTLDNTLFLSKAAYDKHPTLAPIFMFFASKIHFEALHLIEGGVDLLFPKYSIFSNPNYTSTVKRFLKAADLGISDYRILEDKDAIAELVAELSKVGSENQTNPRPEFNSVDFTKLISAIEHRSDKDGPPQRMKLGHQNELGEFQYLDSDQESRGTIVLLKRLGGVLWALDKGSIVVIDELGASLHPMLTAEIIRLFLSKTSNPNGAQLLFTTHQDNLHNRLRRDEISFVQKNRKGASSLTPLSDFRTRQRDDIGHGYMEGRFGGIPNFGSFPNSLPNAGGN